MQNELDLNVSLTLTWTYDQSNQTVDACIHDAAVVGAVAGVITAAGTSGASGVPVAEQTFQDYFMACVVSTIPATDILNHSLNITSQWSQWSACVPPQPELILADTSRITGHHFHCKRPDRNTALL
jgi:hypothetical protein